MEIIEKKLIIKVLTFRLLQLEKQLDVIMVYFTIYSVNSFHF